MSEFSSDTLTSVWKQIDDDNDKEETNTSHVTKKPRMQNFKKLLASVDGIMLEHAICCLLFEARKFAEQRLNESRLPADALCRVPVEAFRSNTICCETCTVEAVPIALYMTDWADKPEDRQQMLNAYHMFLQPKLVEVAGNLGVMTKADCLKRTLHVCSPYCPYVVAQRLPTLISLDDDDDAMWISDWWHSTKLRSDAIPSIVYRCVPHNRFHVCTSNCEFVTGSQVGVKICPLSRRAFADEFKHSFNEGVMPAEQQDKIAEAKGLSGDDENERRRKSIVNSRKQLFASATHEVNGKRVRRGPGDRNNTIRRKINRAMRHTTKDQQTRQSTVASAAEVHASRPYNQKSTVNELPTSISAIARLPFPERANKDNHEFALDALHEMFHRTTRRATFTFSEPIVRRVLFGNSTLFATCCERAAAIFYHLLMGRERCAKERARFEQSHTQAERAVDQFVVRSEANEMPVSVAQCVGVYEATMNVKTRQYPCVELSAEMYATLEAYYAMRATIFFFGLLSLPVRTQSTLGASELHTITNAFSFESFCVVIYDLMHTGYGVCNVTNLARDTFIVERLFPSSTTLKQIGMVEKPVTNIKGIINSLFGSVQPFGVSPQYVLDTTLPWERLAQISMTPNPARRVVEELLNERDAQLYNLKVARPPSPDIDE